MYAIRSYYAPPDHRGRAEDQQHHDQQLRRGIRAMLIDIHYGVPGSYDLGAGPVKYVQTTDASNPKRQLYLCHSRCELGSTLV